MLKLEQCTRSFLLLLCRSPLSMAASFAEHLLCMQDRWKFADLQKQTDQPAAWLKEVLQGIGVLNRKGPNMGLWELQREYRHAK